MISRFNPAVWIVALSRDAGVCQGLAFSYGVHAVQLAEDPENWRDFARHWLREHQVPGAVAMLVAGPSTRNPDANHRLEFLRVGEEPGKKLDSRTRAMKPRFKPRPAAIPSVPPSTADGTNFSLFSRSASRVELLFFDRADDARPSRSIELDPRIHRTYHYWHAFVPGVKAGQLYGYRVHGPSDPAQGMRFDPAKVLLDPYGRGVVVPSEVQSRGGRTIRRQCRHRNEERRGGSDHLRLGRRRAPAPALLADDHLRNARARFHPPSQFRSGGGEARHVRRHDREDSAISSSLVSPPSNCCRCFSSTPRIVRRAASTIGATRRCPSSLRTRPTARARTRSDRSMSFATW